MTSNKQRVALIGTGMIANCAHIPAWKNLKDRVDIVGVCDIRPAAARETALRHNIAWHGTDADEMLAAVQPDIVSVCTPNLFHKEMTLKALRAGAHVVCEKPLTLHHRDAVEMYDAARTAGKQLFANQSMRFRHDFLAAKKLIDEEALGTIYFAEFNRIRRRGVPRWGFFHMKDKNGGGAFCDIGVHFLDALNWMVGNPGIVAVSGSASDLISHLPTDVPPRLADSGAYAGVFTPHPYDPAEFSVEDLAVGSIRFANGLTCLFKVAWAINQPEEFSISLSGSKAGLRIPSMELYGTANGFLTDTKALVHDEMAYKDVTFNGHWYLFEHILAVLDGRETLMIREEEILNVVAAIEAFYRSAASGREVRIDELEGVSREKR
jgi:predicted dehydrogenase